MSDPRIVHISEQFAEVMHDFVPELAPLLMRHVRACVEQGFTRDEAVRLAAALQGTIVSTLMRASFTHPK